MAQRPSAYASGGAVFVHLTAAYDTFWQCGLTYELV